MVICSPFGVNYGINKYGKNGNIVGKRCDRLRNPDFYISGLSFAIAFAVYVFFVVLALFILYGMVGWKILNLIRVKKPTLSSSADKMEQLENEDTCNTIMGENTSDNQMISNVKDGKRKNKNSSRRTVEGKNHKEKEMMVPSDITKSILSIKEKHRVLECKGYEASADTFELFTGSDLSKMATSIVQSRPSRKITPRELYTPSKSEIQMKYKLNEKNALVKKIEAAEREHNVDIQLKRDLPDILKTVNQKEVKLVNEKILEICLTVLANQPKSTTQPSHMVNNNTNKDQSDDINKSTNSPLTIDNHSIMYMSPRNILMSIENPPKTIVYPEPRNRKDSIDHNICPICELAVTDSDSIECNACDMWLHKYCTVLSDELFEKHTTVGALSELHNIMEFRNFCGKLKLSPFD
ncbi:Hypothetical predicted protein [Mytilus galloprovincialis]|uniref:Zinc finger PHD-type domain-containing protein n=1 Tax=Mytilus galloprovincialis TaxID=29158 RepID=A0A8B6GZI8_MYTGA|nr:Hypothetical predicted protein [Mytilus galloprovincialis]